MRLFLTAAGTSVTCWKFGFCHARTIDAISLDAAAAEGAMTLDRSSSDFHLDGVASSSIALLEAVTTCVIGFDFMNSRITQF